MAKQSNVTNVAGDGWAGAAMVGLIAIGVVGIVAVVAIVAMFFGLLIVAGVLGTVALVAVRHNQRAQALAWWQATNQPNMIVNGEPMWFGQPPAQVARQLMLTQQRQHRQEET